MGADEGCILPLPHPVQIPALAAPVPAAAGQDGGAAPPLGV